MNGVQLGDLPQFVDFDYVAGVARANAAGLWSLANAPGTPRDVKVDTTELTNDTTLKWTLDPAAAGYEIVWRPTISPVWTHVVPVGKVATATFDRLLEGQRPDRCPGRRRRRQAHLPRCCPSPADRRTGGVVPDVLVGSQGLRGNKNVGDYLSIPLPLGRHRSDRR